MGRLILLTDLDDTLFTSERKLPVGERPTQAVATDREGNPLSYQSQAQQRVWSVLKESADVIVPVTGRTTAALDRVSLHPKGGLAVVSHGSLIVEEGRVHPAWTDYLRRHSNPSLQIGGSKSPLQTLEEARQMLVDFLSSDGREDSVSVRVLMDQGHPAYLSVKAPERIDAALEHWLGQTAISSALRIHVNGRNAALMPLHAGKANACRFLLDVVLELSHEDTVLTFGDSRSDISFMGQGDMALLPTHSQAWSIIKEIM